jgi:tRNA A37 N6-isopentenylltransferase MiaA
MKVVLYNQRKKFQNSPLLFPCGNLDISTRSFATTVKPKVIVISGTTCSRKTELSLILARTVGGEIISGDSVQVFKHLNIGSDKVNLDVNSPPHHLVDILEPSQPWNAKEFGERARQITKAHYLANDKNRK